MMARGATQSFVVGLKPTRSPMTNGKGKGNHLRLDVADFRVRTVSSVPSEECRNFVTFSSSAFGTQRTGRQLHGPLACE